MHYTKARRIIQLFMALGIAAPIWYAVSNHARLANVQQVTSANAGALNTASAVADSQPVLTTPIVQQAGKQVIISLNTATYKQVKKVEFYVGNQLIGAAYSQPYTISLDANDIGSGTHQVTAKVYTPDTTIESQPATFTTASTPAPVQTVTNSDTSVSTEPADLTPTSQTDATPDTIAAPANVSATASDDGTSAALTWDVVPGAQSYQVWQGSIQVGTATSPNYMDSGLQPGNTYDYQVVAVDVTGKQSDPSAIAAVTMPTPQHTDSISQPQPSSAAQAQTSSPTDQSTD